MSQPPTDPEMLQTMENQARRDLGNRLRMPAADIEVLVSRPVTWSDGALGCPQPGFVYTQALVPGFEIVLKAADQHYHYHAGSHGRPFLCPDDRRNPPLEGRDAPAAR